MTESHATPNSNVLGGAVLLLAAIAAMLFVNLGGADIYNTGLAHKLGVGIGPLVLEKSVQHWINDGLMVLFFLLIGIEINREIRTGALRTVKQATPPVVAAIGGFLVPALFYTVVNLGEGGIPNGWSVPTATDIAFAVALVTVLRDYVPVSLRVFLLALAVADDLMAILVIAIFYTAEVIWMNLFLAACAAVLLVLKSRFRIQKIWIYVLAGLFMWVCVLKSGVHATVAGVIIGLLLPLEGVNGKEAPADTVEHALHPWVRWLVLPLFAFANVGVDVTNLGITALSSSVTWGIVLGLLAGKQVGVLAAVWLLERIGVPRPANATWRQIYGVACLCGIGFTMSLFIGALALPEALQSEVRLGVLIGSVLSAIQAVIVLRGAPRAA